LVMDKLSEHDEKFTSIEEKLMRIQVDIATLKVSKAFFCALIPWRSVGTLKLADPPISSFFNASNLSAIFLYPCINVFFQNSKN
jgi:hypothetical protein